MLKKWQEERIRYIYDHEPVKSRFPLFVMLKNEVESTMGNIVRSIPEPELHWIDGWSKGMAIPEDPMIFVIDSEKHHDTYIKRLTDLFGKYVEQTSEKTTWFSDRGTRIEIILIVRNQQEFQDYFNFRKLIKEYKIPPQNPKYQKEETKLKSYMIKKFEFMNEVLKSDKSLADNDSAALPN